ncbi:carboxymethylenebutenolidase [Catenulispora sp. MAP5-51]|uniref:dienelactone hydrolase family protein n=1 Tax=Catenulispora sp. MAP5-51 TaxID=3156298 RepID=UPI003511A852
MPTAKLQIPTPDGQADAFAAFPDDGERHPGVLFYMDIFGIRPELERKARELAEHGYYVLVPNVFYRDGAAPLVELPEFVTQEVRQEAVAQLMPLVQAQTPERVLRDAAAYLEFLTSRPEVAPGPVAAMGYCMGGGLALRTAAAHADQVAAVAAFHPGKLVSDAPDSVHRAVVPAITADVHIGHAETDMRPEAVSELNQVLDASGVRYTSEIYPGTVHGFTMSDTSAFDAAGLARHWERLLALLDGALATRR